MLPQCHQTPEKVSKHQLAAKGKCKITGGKKSPKRTAAQGWEEQSKGETPKNQAQLTVSLSSQRADELQISIRSTERWLRLSGEIKWPYLADSLISLMYQRSSTRSITPRTFAGGPVLAPQITHPGSVLCDLLPFPFPNSVVLNTHHWFAWSLFLQSTGAQLAMPTPPATIPLNSTTQQKPACPQPSVLCSFYSLLTKTSAAPAVTPPHCSSFLRVAKSFVTEDIHENQRDPFCFCVEWLHSCLCSKPALQGGSRTVFWPAGSLIRVWSDTSGICTEVAAGAGFPPSSPQCHLSPGVGTGAESQPHQGYWSS